MAQPASPVKSTSIHSLFHKWKMLYIHTAQRDCAVKQTAMKSKRKNVISNVIIMLKILWSGIGMVDGRGKIGGTVLTKNRSGAAARVKVTPVNRRTPAQQFVRVGFGFLAQGFRALTASQVAAWNAAASGGFKSNNIFGNPISGSGLNLFVGLNKNLEAVGVATISDPPVQGTVDSPLQMDPTSDTSSTNMFSNLTFDGGSNTVPANTAIVLSATPPVSNGVSFVKSQYRIFTTQDAAVDTTTDNLRAAYVTKFGAPATGSKIFMQAVAVNKTTGQAGPPLTQSFVVVA